MEDDSAIAVFTNKSLATLLKLRGSESWVLNPRHVRNFRYVVCCRNQRGEDPAAAEPHGAAFLVGEIAGIRRTSEIDRVRWRILFERYARVDVPEVWGGLRNPVRYTTLGKLGIAPESLSFVDVPAGAEPSLLDRPSPDVEPHRAVRKLSIAEAKQGLAAMFEVDVSAIEIVIRA